MARKPDFDRELCLQQALKAFWWHGYDKTSLEDLLGVMGIKTSSLYNSFGSKEKLFFEALKYYRLKVGGVRISILHSEDIGGKEALFKYFDHLITRNGDQFFPPGCFMMKTAVSLTDPDSAVGKEVMSAISNLEKGFETALKRGQNNSEFSKSVDVAGMARVFVTEAYGISVLTRTKKSKKELLQTASTLIELLSVKV